MTAAEEAAPAGVPSEANAAPAPADPVQAALAEFSQRLATVEAALGILSPVISEGLTVAGALVPGASPVIGKIAEIGGVLTDLISTLNTHYQGKVSLPAPPAS